MAVNSRKIDADKIYLEGKKTESKTYQEALDSRSNTQNSHGHLKVIFKGW